MFGTHWRYPLHSPSLELGTTREPRLSHRSRNPGVDTGPDPRSGSPCAGPGEHAQSAGLDPRLDRVRLHAGELSGLADRDRDRLTFTRPRVSTGLARNGQRAVAITLTYDHA